MRPRAASPTSQTRILSQGELDFSALGATLLRKKWSVLRPTILVGLVTLLAVQVITPKYQSESRIFIEGRDNVYLRPDADRDTSDRNAVDQEAVTSQAQIILSRDLAQEVINKLKLGERPEFDPTLSGVSPIKAVLGLFGLVQRSVEHDAGRARARSLLRSADGDAGRQFARHRHRFPVTGSRACRASRERHRRRLSGASARSHNKTRQRARATGSPAKSIPCGRRSRTPRPRSRISVAKSNLLVGTNNTTLSAQSLGDVNAQLAAARTQKADAEAKAKMIRDMLHSGEPIEFVRHPQFGTDPASRRAARHVAGAACRAVVHAARRPSAHQGIEGADRRPRRPDQERGGDDRAFVRERRQARQRAYRFASRVARSAQEPGGVDQRPGRAIARA